MALRSDNLIDVYFGNQPDGYFNQTGEAVFKRQLYQCLIAQAIHMKGNIEARRGRNELGMLVWQFNEIWPTGGWGSIEYGTAVPGQVLGGRWKPLHYLYRRSLFADVMAACGGTGLCYVKNDQAGEPFAGQVQVDALEFASGATRVLATRTLQMAAGAGVSERFQLDLSEISAATHMLRATVTASGDEQPLSVNEMLLAPPKDLKLPAATVSATVADGANADGTINVLLHASGTALYVTLATLAQGRFSDNSFAMAPGDKTIQFLPLGPPDVAALRASLRVEHMQPYLL